MSYLTQIKILQSKEKFINLLMLSGELLLSVKLKKDISAIEQTLSTMSRTELLCQLHTDEEKKTFWINIYNAYYQILASRDNTPSKLIFSKKEIHIADTAFSLDDIEHGILRKYRWKKSFGYLPNPFASFLIRKLAVKEIDYRIHFALNCGAKSCPPIAFYALKKINNQLDEAMHAFIESETTIDTKNKIIFASKLMYWYQGDFGGLRGVKHTLKKVLQFETTTYKLKFNPYSWETELENYT
jgi:hypothetical protein